MAARPPNATLDGPWSAWVLAAAPALAQDRPPAPPAATPCRREVMQGGPHRRLRAGQAPAKSPRAGYGWYQIGRLLRDGLGGHGADRRGWWSLRGRRTSPSTGFAPRQKGAAARASSAGETGRASLTVTEAASRKGPGAVPGRL